MERESLQPGLEPEKRILWTTTSKPLKTKDQITINGTIGIRVCRASKDRISLAIACPNNTPIIPAGYEGKPIKPSTKNKDYTFFPLTTEETSDSKIGNYLIRAHKHKNNVVIGITTYGPIKIEAVEQRSDLRNVLAKFSSKDTEKHQLLQSREPLSILDFSQG